MRILEILTISCNILTLVWTIKPTWRSGINGDYDSLWDGNTNNGSSMLKTLHVDRGGTISLPCEVDQKVRQDLIWTKDGEAVWIMQFYPAGYYIQRIRNDPRLYPEGTSLSIKDARLIDAGKYSCELYRLNRIFKYNLVVIAPPKVKPFESSLIITEEGYPATLSCLVSGFPLPELMWFKNGKPLLVNIDKEILVFQKARLVDSGIYTCKAENEYGQTSTANITFEVQFAPKLSVQELTVFTGVGQTAYLFCNVYSLPAARVFWYKHEMITSERYKRKIVSVGVHRLQVLKVREGDLGNYTCNATNIWGSESRVITLTANPSAPIVTLNCYANTTDDCFITSETLSYAPIISYIITFKNNSGDGEWYNITIPGRNSSSIYHTKAYDVSFMVTEIETALKIKAINEFGESGFSQTMFLNLNSSNGITKQEFDRAEFNMGMIAAEEENFTVIELDSSNTSANDVENSQDLFIKGQKMNSAKCIRKMWYTDVVIISQIAALMLSSY